MITIGVDPGLVCTGWGRFDDGVLVAAGMVRGDSDLDTSARVVDIADRLRDVCSGADQLCVERMAYRKHEKVNPEIILALQLLAGTCLRLAKPSADVLFVQPLTWKGKLDGDAHNSRVRLTLTPQERNIVDVLKPKSLLHNVLDGIGLGLFVLNRLTPTTRTLKK